MNAGREVTRLPLAAAAPGSPRHLTVVRYGQPNARPKAYLQAALHADEIPGLLVLHHLRMLLDSAAARGEVIGQVVVNPYANPIGLAQNINSKLLGRHALSGAGNFNRQYPDVVDAVAAKVSAVLGDDAAANVAAIRRALNEVLDARTPVEDTAHLRLTLMRLAADADIVLDLHCDEEALLHVYMGTPLWPSGSDLSAQLGSRITLLAAKSGGNPFDETVGGLWWGLAERFPQRPVPPACLSATLELRGQADVSDDLARLDAENLLNFLRRRGVLAGDPGVLPRPVSDAIPLEAVDIVRAPVQGVVSYTRTLGEQVSAGEVVAVIVDPGAEDPKTARSEVRTVATGLLFMRRGTRFARAGDVLVKVAGATPLADRIGGSLLDD
ncbi:MAG TPA: succinylglutamate desuccinylase/aspartoacylase family protein [Gammaproteobacteria bacterium]|nr:succinylglutamate desuccinylase/aspartoacylase family protein [Gammaproteobacteria bacterium]